MLKVDEEQKVVTLRDALDNKSIGIGSTFVDKNGMGVAFEKDCLTLHRQGSTVYSFNYNDTFESKGE